MVEKVNHEELKKLIKAYYKSKLALLVYGTFGIGKSELTRETAQEIGGERQREFVEWNKLNNEDRLKVYNSPEKYFVLLDVRLSEFDSSDIKGLPNFEQKFKEYIEWKVPFFAKLLEKPESDGILLFDEINLATPIVISSVYKIIYDRIINEGKISNNWLIMGCGNLEEDKAFTHELVPPVRDRGGEVELTFDSEKWIFDYAIKNKIDSRIISFVSFKKGALLPEKDYEDKQKFTTPRGWVRLNELLKTATDDDISLLSCSAIGEGLAREFTAFCKLNSKKDIEEIVKNPALLKNINDISIKYFVVSCLAEKYKGKKEDFEKIEIATRTLDSIDNPELVVLLWRLCLKYSPTAFRKDVVANEKKLKELFNKYGKYLE